MKWPITYSTNNYNWEAGNSIFYWNQLGLTLLNFLNMIGWDKSSGKAELVIICKYSNLLPKLPWIIICKWAVLAKDLCRNLTEISCWEIDNVNNIMVIGKLNQSWSLIPVDVPHPHHTGWRKFDSKSNKLSVSFVQWGESLTSD